MKNFFTLIFCACLFIACESEVVETAPAIITQTLLLESPDGKHQHSFQVEIADTEAERRQGLMHRTHMPADHGMLFIWPKASPISMWMKNTPLPLDILFIHEDIIVQMAENTRPQSSRLISALHPVNMVLELNAKTAERLDISIGYKISLK